MRGAVAINVRPDDATYARIVALAKQEKRSIANCVAWLLANHTLLKAPESKLNGHAHKTASPKTAVTA